MKQFRLPILFGLLTAGLLSGCSLLPGGDSPSGPTPTLLPTFSPPPAATPTAPAPPTLTSSADTPTPGQEPAPTASPSPVEPSPTPQPVKPSPSPAPAGPQAFPDPDQYRWVEVVRGLDRPIGLEAAGDGTGRLFILEQPGVVRILQEGQLLPQPFMDIRSWVGSSANEQGLLGLAFHPRYVENGYFFLHYTDRSGDTVIARYRVSADPNRGDPATEQRLLQVDQPYANHNGGKIAFGPDGYLYIGLGDGGSGGDPQGHGQNRSTLLGALLRIDVDAGEPYAVPDNPFSNEEGRAEIWAYGLRNPWRFSFDRLTGDLYIADVGQNSFEEVNFQPADSPGGENYGWNIMEGFSCFQPQQCDQSGLVLPIYDYPTRAAGNCSVTGGYVYRGSLEAWQGIYLFGDYCSGRVWGLFMDADGEWQDALLFETGQNISTFAEAEDGELYLVGHRGLIFRLEAAAR
jgi:glucose/arabinose dehydrogenase